MTRTVTAWVIPFAPRFLIASTVTQDRLFLARQYYSHSSTVFLYGPLLSNVQMMYVLLVYYMSRVELLYLLHVLSMRFAMIGR